MEREFVFDELLEEVRKMKPLEAQMFLLKDPIDVPSLEKALADEGIHVTTNGGTYAIGVIRK